ncbi:SDR family oxidoreductase [Oceanobacillus jeddahense]|uniref:SDR family oxidoreductase n=1 Tax=Oceanobacillus jeddahense TaxID=1462527 RepID=A0ABY5JSN2_9BACI|nr:SDR family oxidoreductase [Oceanobacillus jeddahense]UUI02457.1 SDR family oxidoreductase [Oceanobacillus jeddahense]
MGLLNDKVILVAGVGRGLGKDVVRNILDEGGSVIMGDLMDDQLMEIQHDLDPSGNQTFAQHLNLADKQSNANLIKAGYEKFNGLDGVIQVAAYDNTMGGLLDNNLDDWDKVSEINIKGTLQLIQEAVPYLKKEDGGAVVFIGSTSAAIPSEDFLQMSYGIGKGALRTATHYLSKELGPLGIRVNNIAPGFKWGPVLESAFQGQADQYGLTLEEVTKPVKDKMALRRFATDDDVAKSCVFFCSDYAKNITGQNLYVDAGYVLN